MPTLARISLFTVTALLACSQTACNMVPQRTLQQSQLRAWQLYHQNKSLAAQRGQARQSSQSLVADKTQLERKNAQLRSNLDIVNQRLGNLNSERSQLQQRYISLLNQAKDQPSPLSNELTRRMQELANRYPGFDFDPQTGVSKFSEDILFTSGKAELRTDAMEILQQFAEIMNDPSAKELNILVVGHTDDRPIAKQLTRSKHPTNWHLSTNRANSVVLALSKYSVKENRMGAAGYSMHQPLVPNTDDRARQRNRRVEIFVLAPDAVVAGWDPTTRRN